MVLADRYVYTAFARDAVRGVDREWLRELYSFAVQPTLAFYFDVPLAEAITRIRGGRAQAQVLRGRPRPRARLRSRGVVRAVPGPDPSRVRAARRRVRSDPHGRDADPDPPAAADARDRAAAPDRHREAVHRPRSARRSPRRTCSAATSEPAFRVSAMTEMNFFGHRPPGIETDALPGRLIVIEATDAAGRSTHVALLKEWLEDEGYAVMDTGSAPLRPRRPRHRAGQRGPHPRSDHAEPVLRDRLLGPPGAPDPAGSACRDGRDRRPVRVLAARARRGPWRLAEMARGRVRVRADPGPGDLPRHRRRASRAACAGDVRLRLLGVGPGLPARPRHVPELRHVPAAAARGVPPAGRSATASRWSMRGVRPPTSSAR